jgi:hypothetical protein
MVTSNPSKEEVRAWLLQELAQHRPPPSLAEIRRTLGWHVAKAVRNPCP